MKIEHAFFVKSGDQIRFCIDGWCEGKSCRASVFLGEKVVKYHRTLTTYVDTLLKNGFELTCLAEPKPPEDMLDLPGMKDEMRRPMMLILSARKV